MRFGVLGALRVLDDHGTETVVPAAKHRVLLAALLLNANRQVSREALVDVLWDRPPPNAAAALRTYLTRLRAVLGEASDRIISTPAGIAITLHGAAEFDVAEAEELHRSALTAMRDGRRAEAAATLRRAEALWRGRPLADIPSDVLCRRELPRLEELRLAVIEQRIDVELGLGRAGDLVGELRALVAAHPLRERAYAQLMLALYRAQRRGEALDVYRDAREVLREQLGADPTSQLRELHQRILAGRPVPDSGDGGGSVTPAPDPAAGPDIALLRPRQLPVAPRGFAGRARELKQLEEISNDLGAGTVVISAVNGTAGVGKTALALHWAHRNTARFPDGQLYVNLRGFDPGEDPVPPAAVLRDFLAALGVPGDRIPAGLEPRSALYRSLLAGRRVLVVLDNARDARQVRPLLPAAPGCLTLVTSRTELRGLVVAEGARALPLLLMDVDEAGELLARKLGAERIHEDAAATRDLIDLCARLPLALSIAAAYIDARRHATVRSFAEDLRAASTSLDLLGVDDPLTDLRTVLSCSVQALNPDAALAFRLLGLVPGRDVPAEAVAALTGLGAERTGRALDELVDANLLTEAAAGRYLCHDLLCAYARELAARLDAGLAEQASRRLLGWYVYAACAADQALDYRDRRYRPSTVPEPERVPTFAGHDQADAWFAAEHANLAAAVSMAAERALDPAAWDLAMLPWNYYYRNRLLDEWLQVLLAGLGAARERGTPRNVQSMLHMLGLCYRNRQELPEAIDAYEQAVALARTMPDLHLNVSLNNLAMAYLYSNRGADAIRCLDEALAIVEAFGDETAATALLNNIGDAHRYLGQFEQALPYLERGLTLALALGDSMAAYLLATLGEVHIGLANFRTAADYCRRSVDLLRGLKHPSLMVKVLDIEGSALRADGDRAGARDCWTEALALCEQFELPEAVMIRAHLAQLDRTG